MVEINVKTTQGIVVPGTASSSFVFSRSNDFPALLDRLLDLLDPLLLDRSGVAAPSPLPTAEERRLCFGLF